MSIKRLVSVLFAVALLALLVSASASASPDRIQHVTGYAPLTSVVETETTFEYDVCDPIWRGHAVQPLGDSGPGNVIRGVTTWGPVENCEYSQPTDSNYSGSCKYVLAGVEEFGNPDSEEGWAKFGNCTGDFEGLLAKFQIHYLYDYDAWYLIPW